MSAQSIASFLKALTTTGKVPLSEARVLLMHVLQKTRIQLITQVDYVLSESECNAVEQQIRRRMQGEPIAYLIGEREFFGLTFQVTPDVLIPRPETELLVELGLQLAPQHSSLLDLGTGSGAIAVALAHQRPDLTMWASDVCRAALAVAQQNAARHQCAIHFVESDWYSHLPNQLWHTIISNPPYIVQDDIHLSQGDLRFEPINALTDHADGLSAFRRIIQGALTRLAPGGWLLMEHGYNQAQAVRSLLAEKKLFSQIQSWHDLAHIERVTGAQYTQS